MRTLLGTLICVVMIVASSSLALAQNNPATNGNNDYNDGAIISGHTMNFRFDPIGLIVGAVDANLDFALSKNWTLGPELAYWHTSISSSGSFTSNFDTTAIGFGARANWFPNGIFKDGLYIGPDLVFASASVKTSDSTGNITASDSGIYAGCLVGYGWFWQTFNIMLGGGATLGLGNNQVTVTDSSGNTTDVSSSVAGLALEFSLGWAF